MTSPEVLERLEHALETRYKIDRELGRGGMATVYLAHDLKHERRVALKVMHPEIAFALGRERFLREIRFAAGLSHPHIVSIHDSGEADGLLFYVMPFVDGESLRHRLQREKKLPVPDALLVACEVADALGYAHSSNIVHRDIKPENILISRGHASLADFGIAWAVGAARDDRITATGISLGTPAYMSPEQALGEPVDASTDVWALGCVLYEMIAGFPPFGREPRQVLTRSLTSSPSPLKKVRGESVNGIQNIVDRALARSREERIANGTDFGEALENIATRPSARSHRHGHQRRLTKRIGILAAAIAAIVLISAVGMWRIRNGSARNGAASIASSTRAQESRVAGDSAGRQLYARGRAQLARRTRMGAAD